ncbi:TonB-dependent receptor [Leptolyngbya sp. NK1-12]|uniref:TonB-dependent receptor n=1 Tax=Leptolyngbya sp. NK1-12 TaxID=2547451 RepID=A0AA97ALQ4_9CYAN|nr:TonB-dependent receptor [Leptolyngbya sp. NK1-12]WNZ27781.1 TonB-dependent receptor [Leptolyngbya sp. NK1-12]
MVLKQQRWGSIGLTGAVLLLLAPIAWAEESGNQQDEKGGQPSALEQPATTVEEWLAQIAQVAIIQVTGIQLNATDTGIDVILETAAGQLPEPSTSVVGNALIVEIPNAALTLPEGNEFQQANPAEGIALISVTSLPDNWVRVAITGLGAPPTGEIRADAQSLVLSVVPGTDAADDAEDAIQVVVTGEQAGYQVDEATTATRTDTPLRDIPQSIQVVPRQVLEDQQVIELEEAVRNVSGVVPGNTFGNTQDGGFVIRGFPSFDLYLRNGFRDNAQGIREFANIERIEVLKGPASVLYGNLEPGGVINFITEMPLADPYYSTELELGNYGFARPTIDLSGPLNDDETLLYRLNAAYLNQDGFRNFSRYSERYFVAPVLTWQISNRTDLTLEFDYVRDERPFDRGLVVLGDAVADIPISRVLGERDDLREVEEIGVGYRFEHRFSDNWRVRNAFRMLFTDSFDYAFQPSSLDEATGELSRNLRSNEDYRESYALQTELVGEFSTGPIEHTLLVGVDWSRNTLRGNTRAAESTPSINIFDPDYGAVRPERSDLPLLTIDRFNATNTIGFFIQNQIDLLDNLHLLVGGRFDIIDQRSTNFLDGSSSNQNEDAFSPRIGIVYQPIEPLSLYASYSQSFQPNAFTQSDGSFLEPERGRQFEIGIRGEFLDDRLIANLAAYHITKTNVATTDPDDPNFSLPLGEVRSQGIEFDVAGEILPGWNIIASYAYTDAEVTESGADPFFPEGLRIANVAPNTASLWTTYEIQSGTLQGLGFGIGLFYVDNRPGDFDNTYELPSFLRTDAAIYYRRDNWRIALNVKNLLDEQYFAGADFGRVTVRPGEPFTILGSVAVEF